MLEQTWGPGQQQVVLNDTEISTLCSYSGKGIELGRVDA